MLAAKPVLVSSNRIKDPVELSGCGLVVEPDNAETIADGIIKLMSLTDDDRISMGNRGREFVLKYHNYSYLSKEYSKLFT